MIIGLPHLFYIFIPVFQRFHRRILACGRCAHNGKLVDFQHLFHNYFRATCIPQPPSGHSVSFGKSVNQNRPFFHPRQRGNGYMLPFICKFRIYFIRNHKDVFFNYHFGNLFQVFPLHDCPCRIIRKWKNQNFCLIRNCIQKLLCRQPKFIFCLQFNNDRNRIGQNRTRFIGHIAGLRNQYFLSVIHHCPKGNINRFRTSYRNNRFFVIIVINPLFSF